MSDQTVPAVEIRDPALDDESLARAVQQQAARRRASNPQLDWAALERGPLPPPISLPDSAGGDDFPGLRDSLAELIARGTLYEPNFSSNAPLVAPLIIAIRRLWNWMSTKWYVRPILWQQSELNARTARVVSDLAQWHELDARRLAALEARVAELEAHLARAGGLEETIGHES